MKIKEKIINIIYDNIKDYNFYNYDNDKSLKNIEIRKFNNILNDDVIEIKINKSIYIINCMHVFEER